MTRSASWLFLLSLALAGAAEAKKSSNVKEVCTTLFVDRKGTRTHRAAEEVTTIIKHAKACTSTAKTIKKAKTTTVTSLVPTYITQDVQYPQETDVFTSTKWSFDFVFPTTTLTEISTPTATEMLTIRNPDDIIIKTTSYTLQAPAASPAPQRRGDGQDWGQRAIRKESSTKAIIAGHANGAILGKDIYCHKEKTVTTTLDPLHPTRPCERVTLTKKGGPRQTVVTKVPFPITVTRTNVPKDVTRTAYELQESTVTAPMSTTSITIIGPASTTTSTITADVATETIIVPEYAVCEPSRFSPARGFRPTSDVGYGEVSVTSAADCCHAAASKPGGAFFLWMPDENACAFLYADNTDVCPAVSDNMVYNPPAFNRVGGQLQCGPF